MAGIFQISFERHLTEFFLHKGTEPKKIPRKIRKLRLRLRKSKDYKTLLAWASRLAIFRSRAAAGNILSTIILNFLVSTMTTRVDKAVSKNLENPSFESLFRRISYQLTVGEPFVPERKLIREQKHHIQVLGEYLESVAAIRLIEVTEGSTLNRYHPILRIGTEFDESMSQLKMMLSLTPKGRVQAEE